MSNITGTGKLSGKKTDMAVNVYTPGCHLLCHDDVIGTRRVSYILYLTDPDEPWKDEWGGALRLYPTLEMEAENKDGKKYKVPSPNATVRIPPAFGQLSFFAVQPGESFHDVEEVYADDGTAPDGKGAKKRVRTAISGWYHIPQEGEDGYEPGLEEKLAEKSSLMQLQGKADQFDLPQPAIGTYQENDPTEEGSITAAKRAMQEEVLDDDTLTQSDLEFLLKYLAPTYLTPDTLESVAAAFTDNCSLILDNFLSHSFSESARFYIMDEESESLPEASADIESKTAWKVARPPHKHRYLFQQPDPISPSQARAPSQGLPTPPASFPQPGSDGPEGPSPIHDLLTNLLPSRAFKKWLQLATAQTLLSHNLLARRFRKGKDYTLATGYDNESPRLEITLAITPTKGWGEDGDSENEVEEGEAKEDQAKEDETKQGETKGSEVKADVVKESEAKESEVKEDKTKEVKVKEGEELKTTKPDGTLSKKDNAPTIEVEPTPETTSVGGYLAYIAGDDDDPSDSGSDNGIEVPPSLSTGARSTGPRSKKLKADPAVYKAPTDPDDDGTLFSMPAGWNRLGIVLRDQGTMRFVKYVSASAKGDRWDVMGEFGIVDEGEEGDEEDGGSYGGNGVGVDDEGEEETEIEELLGESSEESSD